MPIRFLDKFVHSDGEKMSTGKMISAGPRRPDSVRLWSKPGAFQPSHFTLTIAIKMYGRLHAVQKAMDLVLHAFRASARNSYGQIISCSAEVPPAVQQPCRSNAQNRRIFARILRNIRLIQRHFWGNFRAASRYKNFDGNTEGKAVKRRRLPPRARPGSDR